MLHDSALYKFMIDIDIDIDILCEKFFLEVVRLPSRLYDPSPPKTVWRIRRGEFAGAKNSSRDW